MRRSVVAALGAVLMACDGNTYVPPPPPEVTVAQPQEREVTTYNEFSGHTASIEAVDIRARVQGFLKSMHFSPGTEVNKGDLLFVIEPDLYRARVEQAEADLQGAKAQAQAAEDQLAITKAIFERQAGSKTDLVQKLQARDSARARMAQARATLDAAKLDLSYTHIYAPISGRIDRNFVDIGNLVGAGEATLLASIVRHDPIYAYFDASERELLVYRDLNRRGETAAAAGERNRAYMGLVNEEGFPHEGMIDYSSNRVESFHRDDRDTRGLPQPRARDHPRALRARAAALHPGPGRARARRRRRARPRRALRARGGRQRRGRVPARRGGTARRRHADRPEGRGDRRLDRRERAPARAPGEHGQADARGRDGRLGGKMISRFFIDRPIFANVIAIVTVIFGLVSAARPAGRAVSGRSRRRRYRSRRRIPGPTHRWSPTPSPRRSSSR